MLHDVPFSSSKGGLPMPAGAVAKDCIALVLRDN